MGLIGVLFKSGDHGENSRHASRIHNFGKHYTLSKPILCLFDYFNSCRPSANSHSDQSQFNSSLSASSTAAGQPPPAVVSNSHHPQNAQHAPGHSTNTSAINKPNSQHLQQHHTSAMFSTPPHAVASSLVCSGQIHGPAVATPAPRLPREQIAKYPPAAATHVSDSHTAQFLHSTPTGAVHNFKTHHNVAPPPPLPLPHLTRDSNASSHHHQHFFQQQQQHSSSAMLIPERDTGPITPSTATPPTPPTSSASACPPLPPLPNSKASTCSPNAVAFSHQQHSGNNNSHRNHSSIPPHRSMSGPAKLTIQSIPVKSQPPMLSSGLSSQHRNNSSNNNSATAAAPQVHRNQYSGTPHLNKSPHQPSPPSTVHLTGSQMLPTTRPQHIDGGGIGVVAVPARTVTHHQHQHHISSDAAASEFRSGILQLHRVPESSCHSSSDENRSSGHASMSDTGGHGSSSPGGHMELGDSTEHLSGAVVGAAIGVDRLLMGNNRGRGGGNAATSSSTTTANTMASPLSSTSSSSSTTGAAIRAINSNGNSIIVSAGMIVGGNNNSSPAARQAAQAQHPTGAQQTRSTHHQQQHQAPQQPQQQRHHQRQQAAGGIGGGGSASHNFGKVPWNGGGGLADIKLAIQQLTMRSHTSTTSTYSSLSAGSESSEPAAVRRGQQGNGGTQNGQGNSGGNGGENGGNGGGGGNRNGGIAGGNNNNGNSSNNNNSGNNNGGGLGRYASLETVNTNVTSADEFVWVDSHNRLVELQHPPWSHHCVWRVIRSGRCRELADRVAADAVPRLGYLLQRALVRVAREVQRLSAGWGLCSKHEVAGAFRIVVCPALADSCIKACLRAAAMFAVPGDGALRQSKSARAGLQLPVGRFHRWMADAKLGRFVHEYAAVYLCAGVENLLEEILLQCLTVDGGCVGSAADGRTAAGHQHAAQMLLLKQQQSGGGGGASGGGSGQAAPSLSAASLEQAIASCGDLWGLLQPYAHLNAGRVASGALTMPRWTSQASVNQAAAAQQGLAANVEPCLLTTCVGSAAELRDLILRAQSRFQNVALSQAALTALYYFMRCSQLEHSDGMFD